jgi:hypothetical protein
MPKNAWFVITPLEFAGKDSRDTIARIVAWSITTGILAFRCFVPLVRRNALLVNDAVEIFI